MIWKSTKPYSKPMLQWKCKQLQSKLKHDSALNSDLPANWKLVIPAIDVLQSVSNIYGLARWKYWYQAVLCGSSTLAIKGNYPVCLCIRRRSLGLYFVETYETISDVHPNDSGRFHAFGQKTIGYCILKLGFL